MLGVEYWSENEVCALPGLDMSADVGGEGIASIHPDDIFSLSRTKEFDTPEPANITYKVPVCTMWIKWKCPCPCPYHPAIRKPSHGR